LRIEKKLESIPTEKELYFFEELDIKNNDRRVHDIKKEGKKN
jgi:hypothetical protein